MAQESTNQEKQSEQQGNKYIRTRTLPDGRVAGMKEEAKGKHMRKIRHVVRDMNDPTDISFGLIEQLVEIDGEPVFYDELDEMLLTDINEIQLLMNESGEGKAETQAT